jgi:hypothetical protein
MIIAHLFLAHESRDGMSDAQIVGPPYALFEVWHYNSRGLPKQST